MGKSEARNQSAASGGNARAELHPENDAALLGIPRVGEEILGGKYVIERVVGVGGMGVVCAAMHRTLKQRVAVKFLAASMRTPELVDRFMREGQAAVRIKSEHIAPVLDVGQLENGTPYLLMEHLTGSDLGDYLLERKALPIEEAIDFVLQALDALAVAHAAGVVHRDLKPANLFVTQRSDGSPLVKVLDFGISKVIERGDDPGNTLTRPGMMLGSPRYMSPEQLRNASTVDHRADIWAMGVVLHELITGQPPFDADTFTALCAIIVSEPPVPLRAALPSAPEELERVILRCLDRRPDARYQDVGELAQAIAPFASPESRVLAKRVSKIVGNKTPSGSVPHISVAETSKPSSERTLPMSDPHGGRRSSPSPMATTGSTPRLSSGSPMAISAAPPNAARKKGPLLVSFLALAALVTLVAFARQRLVPSASVPPAPSPAVVASQPAVAAEPAPERSAAVSAASPEPAVAASTAPSAARSLAGVPAVPAPRPRLAAAPKPSASASAPSPAAAQPSEADLLNRRR